MSFKNVLNNIVSNNMSCKYVIKQPGAELCQAQLQLGSIKPGKDGKGRLKNKLKLGIPGT